MSLNAASITNYRGPFVSVNATLGDAAKILGTTSLRGLPVVDDTLQVVGWIQDRVLLSIVYSHKLASHSVATAMATDVIVVDEDASLVDTLDLMLLTQVDALPVISNGTCLGVVTNCDILRFVSEIRQKRLARMAKAPEELVAC